MWRENEIVTVFIVGRDQQQGQRTFAIRELDTQCPEIEAFILFYYYDSQINV
jgi:hypothetical protein